MYNAAQIVPHCTPLPSGGYTLPSFVAAGAGAAHQSTLRVIKVPFPAGASVGQWAFMHVMSRTASQLPASISGWTILGGIDAFVSGRQQAVYVRKLDGTEGSTQDVVLAGTPNVAIGRMYVWDDLVESGGLPLMNNVATATGTSAAGTFNMPSLTTTQANGLCMFFACFDEDTAIPASTGETGGDWVEPTAEYLNATGSGAVIFVQTAAMSSVGTISGGSVSNGSSSDGVRRSFAVYGNSGVPTFVAAGAGAVHGVEATLTMPYPAGISNGDLLVAQLGSRTSGALPTAIAGWEPMGGVTTVGSNQHVAYIRVYDGSASSLIVSLSGVLDLCVGRIYAFQDVDGFNAGGVEDLQTANDTGSAPAPSLGPTSRENMLGLSLVFIDDDNAIGAFSGASGGTWAEAVAEYTSTGGTTGATLQCQTVDLGAAGNSVSGGSVSVPGDNTLVRSWAFKGVAV